MPIIGLTGGIGSGKSTAANFFRAFADVIDADEIARQVVALGSPTLNTIKQHFGKNATLPEGSLNRAWLRQIIFSNPTEKAWLENLLHPLIRTKIIAELNNSKSFYTILMSPLLLETDQFLLVDRIIVIDASDNIKIDRVIKRDNSTAEAVKAIIDTQLSRWERLKKADDIIINNEDTVFLKKSISHLNNLYQNLFLL